jgi:hypothetical protein
MRRRLRRLAAASVFALGLLLSGSAAHAQQGLYWIDTNFPAPRMGRSNPDGTIPISTPLTVGSLPEGLALDPASSMLYWTESAWSGAHVNRMGANFADRLSLLSAESSLHGIAIDATHGTLYWTSSKLATSAVILESLGPLANPRGIIVDVANSRVVWTDYDLGAIYSCGLAGGTVSTLFMGPPGLWGLAYNPAANQFFVTNYITGTLQTAGPPPFAFTTIVSGLANPSYVALDVSGGKVYWSEAGAGAQKVQRANLNGTVVQNLNLPVTHLGGLAIGTPALTGVPLPPDSRPVTEFALAPPTPNPARQSAQVEFDLPSAAAVVLRVMDIQGREVARLAEGEFPAGRHHAEWSLTGGHARPAAGLYFLRFEAAGRVLVRRLAVVH